MPEPPPTPHEDQPTAPADPRQPTFQAAPLPPENPAAPSIPARGNVIAPPYEPALAGLVEGAKADLARRRSVALDAIAVVDVRDVIWPDPGLGCPQPGMAYKQVPVDGLLIRLSVAGSIFNYHSGGGKAPFLCEQPAPGDRLVPPPGGEGQ